MITLGRYSIAIFITLAALAVTSCTNSKKVADCQQFKKGIEMLGVSAANNLKVFSVNSKQGYVTYLNSLADGEEQAIQIWNSLQLQDLKSKEIQNHLIQGSRAMIQVLHDQAKAIDSLPQEPTPQIRNTALKPFEPAKREASKQMSDAANKISKHCGY
jgi:hypothetical protein